jgi:hypothetical protein
MKSLTEWERIHDGCVIAKYRHRKTGEITSQRKRRPRDATDTNVCSWHLSVHCDDHPDRPGSLTRLLLASGKFHH